MQFHAKRAQKDRVYKCARGPCRHCGLEVTLNNRARHEKECRNRDPLDISPRKFKTMDPLRILPSEIITSLCEICNKSFCEKSALEWHRYSEHGKIENGVKTRNIDNNSHLTEKLKI